MSKDAPCPICVRIANPGITFTQLQEIGATTEEMCERHRSTYDKFREALRVDITRSNPPITATALNAALEKILGDKRYT